jgi:hypothetical protein
MTSYQSPRSPAPRRVNRVPHTSLDRTAHAARQRDSDRHANATVASTHRYALPVVRELFAPVAVDFGTW